MCPILPPSHPRIVGCLLGFTHYPQKRAYHMPIFEGKFAGKIRA